MGRGQRSSERRRARRVLTKMLTPADYAGFVTETAVLQAEGLLESSRWQVRLRRASPPDSAAAKAPDPERVEHSMGRV